MTWYSWDGRLWGVLTQVRIPRTHLVPLAGTPWLVRPAPRRPWLPVAMGLLILLLLVQPQPLGLLTVFAMCIACSVALSWCREGMQRTLQICPRCGTEMARGFAQCPACPMHLGDYDEMVAPAAMHRHSHTK